MRTSFHHQPEAQHPHSPAIYTPVGRLPHLLSALGLGCAVLTNPGHHFKRIGLEAGPLSQWLAAEKMVLWDS